MSLNYRVDRNNEYLKFLCEGTYNIVELLDIYAKALEIAKKEGYKGILMDVRDMKDATLTTMERYEIGETVAKMQIKDNKYIYLAVVGEEPFVDPNRFSETVAVNRGAMGKVFTDIVEAEKWVYEVINK